MGYLKKIRIEVESSGITEGQTWLAVREAIELAKSLRCPVILNHLGRTVMVTEHSDQTDALERWKVGG